jgi:hypothetical protein
VTSDQSRLKQLMAQQMVLESHREGYWDGLADDVCENVPIEEQEELPMSAEELVRLTKSIFTF